MKEIGMLMTTMKVWAYSNQSDFSYLDMYSCNFNLVVSSGNPKNMKIVNHTHKHPGEPHPLTPQRTTPWNGDEVIHNRVHPVSSLRVLICSRTLVIR